MEKFKIISDETGATCQLLIDGKRIEDVTSIRIAQSPVSGRYGLQLEVVRNRKDDKGRLVVIDNALMQDTYLYDFSKDFGEYMNPPEEENKNG